MHAVGIIVVLLIVIWPGADEYKTVADSKFFFKHIGNFIRKVVRGKSTEETD